jgi:hypothetical protein
MFRTEAGSSDPPSPAAVSRVGAALGRLDAFSFWVVPAGPGTRGDLIVVGTTGAFLIEACSLAGRLDYGRGVPKVGGVAIPGLVRLRKSAKRVTATLNGASVFVDAEPVLCLTEAVAGAATTAKGVVVLPLRDLVAHVSSRPRVLEQGRAQRGARALGMTIAGDHKRHFTVG